MILEMHRIIFNIKTLTKFQMGEIGSINFLRLLIVLEKD